MLRAYTADSSGAPLHLCDENFRPLEGIGGLAKDVTHAFLTACRNWRPVDEVLG